VWVRLHSDDLLCFRTQPLCECFKAFLRLVILSSIVSVVGGGFQSWFLW
jgi:hypothetical protein